MEKTRIDVPVLVIGAGPIGLGMALDLGWRGIGCLVVEREADRSAAINAHPRAAAITPRTMEFLRRWGVSQNVYHSGFPLDLDMNIVYCIDMQGPLVHVQHFDAIGRRPLTPHSPERRNRCPQFMYDPILEAGLGLYPQVQLRQPWQLDEFADTGSEVIAQVSDVANGKRYEVHAQYMVACDGGNSMARDMLGIATEGTGLLSYSINAILEIPDFFNQHDKGPAERYMFLNHKGVWSELTVIDGRNRWRLGYNGSADESDRAGIDMPDMIRRVLGPNVKYELVALTPWKRREQMAAQFRKGRVFLAGDAAHAMPPNLGMGMNTGMGDVFDLGWKLEAALRGWAGPGLLDSYEAERKPVATDIAETSTRTYRRWVSAPPDYTHIAEDSERGAAARRSAVAHIDATLPDGWDTLGFQIGYRYDDSPIIVPDGSPKPAPRDDVRLRPFTPTARPGAAAPHAWLPDGRSILDAYGRGYTLVDFGGGGTAALEVAARTRGVPLATLRVREPEIAALYANKYVLVRPDNHVAWRGDALPADCLALIDKVRGA